MQENAFENVVCEMAAIFSWPQFVNKGCGYDFIHTYIHKPREAIDIFSW